MAERFTKVGISMLNMHDIEEYLHVKGFIYNSESANDTTHVGGVPSENIAVAVSPEDRTTVRNAMNLNGKPESYFFPAVKGALLNNDTEAMRNAYNAAIASLKSEVYELRAEIASAGLGKSYATYEGFYDPFRRQMPRHIKDVVATSVEDSKDPMTKTSIIVSEDNWKLFKKDDHIVLHSKVENKVRQVQVVEASKDGKTIIFTPAVDFRVLKDEVDVYRSYGSVVDGAFVMGEIIATHPGQKTYHTSTDDDTHWIVRKINSVGKGVGTTFRIPTSYQRNYLGNIMIKVKKFGQPGPLKCYVINEKNLTHFKNPIQAKDDGLLVAESYPLNVDASKDMHLAEFKMFDPYGEVDANTRNGVQALNGLNGLSTFTAQSNPSNYPLLKEYDNSDTSNTKVRYVMIIEALTNADDTNYYDVTFIATNKMATLDVHNMNKALEYTKQGQDSRQNALVTNYDIDAADLYYGITLYEAEGEQFIPHDTGIYTTHWKNADNKASSKIKVNLRIGREGVFYLTDEYNTQAFGDFPDNAIVNVKGKEVFDVDGFYYSKNRPVAFGDMIREVSDIQHTALTVKKGFHADKNAKVYPINYKVIVKAKLTEWDPEVCKTKVLQEGRYEVPLSRIINNGWQDDETLSDRIVFETDFKDEKGNALYYNDFEVEIFWEKSCKESNAKLIGKIEDLWIDTDTDVLIEDRNKQLVTDLPTPANTALNIDALKGLMDLVKMINDSKDTIDKLRPAKTEEDLQVPADYWLWRHEGPITAEDIHELQGHPKVYAPFVTELHSDETDSSLFTNTEVTHLWFPNEMHLGNYALANSRLVEFRAPKVVEFGHHVFANSKQLKNVVELDTHVARDLTGTFQNCSALINVGDLVTDNCLDFTSMFDGCNALKYVPNVTSTANAESMEAMLRNCHSIRVIPPLNYSNVKNLNSAFERCSGINSAPTINGPKVTTANKLFKDCSSMTLADSITLPMNRNFEQAFKNCSVLETLPTIHYDNVKVSRSMFENCNAIEAIDSVELSQQDANAMFKGCNSLKHITNMSTTGVSNMSNMFANCYALIDAELDLNVVDNEAYEDFYLKDMFTSDKNITHILIRNVRSIRDLSIPEGYQVMALENNYDVIYWGDYKEEYAKGISKVVAPSGYWLYNRRGPISIETQKELAGHEKVYAPFVTLVNPGSIHNDVKDLWIPNDVTLANSAFHNTKLEVINLPHIVKMGKSVFDSCKQLTTVTNLDLSNVYVYDGMFANCEKLVNLPRLDNHNAVSTDNMFENCGALKELVIRDIQINDLHLKPGYTTENLPDNYIKFKW